MTGLCEGSNEPPVSLKAAKPDDVVFPKKGRPLALTVEEEQKLVTYSCIRLLWITKKLFVSKFCKLSDNEKYARNLRACSDLDETTSCGRGRDLSFTLFVNKM
ncbi:hypothetical protein ANN_00516 [Periplaneta americana]|uniref:Uncharacterized protein n=1 Tax=Periplaneta americana TaxID=6978 RepID=A0ABQ8TSP9_PERAM|nr:hypothetical protein ANN_00516 [Periplaneta americana]